MARVYKILAAILSTLVICALSLLLFGRISLNQSLPKVKGTLELDGLREGVEVLRDKYGVPHIFASEESDLFFAQGFVTAQDRFWQMDLSRRVAEGKLSEIFGDTTVHIDKLMRTIGLGTIADSLYSHMPESSRTVLDAYAAGVNAYLATMKSPPLECRILRYTPELWKPRDSLAYMRYMAWTLTIGWTIDLVFADLSEKLPVHMLREILPDDPAPYFPVNAPTARGEINESYRGPAEDVLVSLSRIRQAPTYRASVAASNNWVIAAEKSSTGTPILCNDPHLMLSVPTIWYEVHLRGAGYDVCGVSLPGIPGIPIGHNTHIAWGITNAMIDDADLCQERIDPADSSRYQKNDEWRTMEIVSDTIFVKGGEPVPRTLFRTANGPVISRVHPLTEEYRTALSLRWSGYEFSDEVAAYKRILRASSWPEFLEGVSYYGVPAQNMVYADIHGNIGYCLAGRIPDRRTKSGIMPLRGWYSGDDWRGTKPFTQNPQSYNPETSFIATANNRITTNRAEGYLSAYWAAPDRIERITDFLSETDRISVEHCKMLQADVLSYRAKKVLPFLLAAMDESHGDYADIRALLQNWDCVEHAYSIPACVFNSFYRNFLHNLFSDEMGDLAYETFISFPFVAIRASDALLSTPHSVWFDDIATSDVRETANEILLKSLDDGLAELETLFGPDPANWRWGKLHRLRFPHVFEGVPFLGQLFCIGPFDQGGSGTTVNAKGYSYTAPYGVAWGPATRQIVAMNAPEAALSVVANGQSGHRFSPHWDDQTDFWLNGNYRTVHMNRQKIETEKHTLLQLCPPRNSKK